MCESGTVTTCISVSLREETAALLPPPPPLLLLPPCGGAGSWPRAMHSSAPGAQPIRMSTVYSSIVPPMRPAAASACARSFACCRRCFDDSPPPRRALASQTARLPIGQGGMGMSDHASTNAADYLSAPTTSPLAATAVRHCPECGFESCEPPGTSTTSHCPVPPDGFGAGFGFATAGLAAAVAVAVAAAAGLAAEAVAVAMGRGAAAVATAAG